MFSVLTFETGSYKTANYDWFSFQIKNYPKIRDELENRIISFIYTKAPEQKRNVLELLKMEKAYQNTNHEDFNPDSIGFERQGILKIMQLNDDKQGKLSIKISIRTYGIVFHCVAFFGKFLYWNFFHAVKERLGNQNWEVREYGQIFKYFWT